jgi:hypothetical protein
LHYAYSMTITPKLNFDSIVAARLDALGADRLPFSVRCAINADLLKACTDFLHERITREYVGDLVKQGLEAPAATSATSTGGAL